MVVRRLLAACRAVLFAQLVDDPSSDPAYRRPDGSVDEERAGIKRAELFNLIEELVRLENLNNPNVINRARAEIACASRKIELGELINKFESVKGILDAPVEELQKVPGLGNVAPVVLK